MCDVVCPVGDTGCHIAVGGMDNTVVNLTMVDGRFDLVSQKLVLQNDRWYRIRLRITQATIEAWVDEEKVVNFATAGHKVTLNTPILGMQPVGLRTWKTASAVRNVRVRRLKQ